MGENKHDFIEKWIRKEMQKSWTHMKVSWKLCDKSCIVCMSCLVQHHFSDYLSQDAFSIPRFSCHIFSQQMAFNTNLGALQCHGPSNRVRVRLHWSNNSNEITCNERPISYKFYAFRIRKCHALLELAKEYDVIAGKEKISPSLNWSQ